MLDSEDYIGSDDDSTAAWGDGSEQKLFVCPSDRLARGAGRPPPRSYVVNGTNDYTAAGLEDSGTVRPMGNALSMVRSPARCVVIADGAPDDRSCMNWCNGLTIRNDSSGLRWPHRSGHAAIFGFSDGHVRAVDSTQLAPTSALASSAMYFAIYSVTASDDDVIPTGRY